MRSLIPYVKLTRPLNLLIAFISIFIGGFVTGTIQPLNRLLLACFSGVLIGAGANAINDFLTSKWIGSTNRLVRYRRASYPREMRSDLHSSSWFWVLA